MQPTIYIELYHYTSTCHEQRTKYTRCTDHRFCCCVISIEWTNERANKINGKNSPKTLLMLLLDLNENSLSKYYAPFAVGPFRKPTKRHVFAHNSLCLLCERSSISDRNAHHWHTRSPPHTAGLLSNHQACWDLFAFSISPLFNVNFAQFKIIIPV